MDDKARKALIDELAVASKFDAAYSEPNRRWMVGKLISVFENRVPVPPDTLVKTKTTDTVTKSKPIVAKHRNFKFSLKISNNKEAATERTLKSRRVEILYGLIAHTPELAEAANEAQIVFIAKRRYRSIERFEFFVNPNSRGYFRYRRTCPADPHWRINVDATTHWVRNTPDLIPIELVTPPDPPDILTALNKLFVSKKKPCEGNLFDCAIILSIVFMDSLREAKDARKLLEKLYTRGSTYLCIDHTNTTGLFTHDTTAESLYVRADFPQDDMQVGDHVYIHNHGLYQRLEPEGSWRGEHALMTDCGNRQLQSDTGYRFMGHGMPRGGETGSIPRFYAGLLSELNTLLYRSYRMGAIFLFYMRSGGTAFPGDVTKETETVPDPGGTGHTVDFYFFDVGFTYPNYEKKPPKGKKLAQTSGHGFVIWHIDALRQFGIHFKKTIADAKADGIFGGENGVLFKRSTAPATAAEMFDAPAWGIPFPDSNDVEQEYLVFEKKGAATTINLLELPDLYVQPLGRLDPTAPSGVETTRPKVDVGSTYTTFLSTTGAI